MTPRGFYSIWILCSINLAIFRVIFYQNKSRGSIGGLEIIEKRENQNIKMWSNKEDLFGLSGILVRNDRGRRDSA